MNFDAIPDELKQRIQWVCWKLIPAKDGTKPRKIPVQVNGKAASTKAPKTWTTFEKAKAAAQAKGFAGIGYVLTPDDLYSIIDLDDALEADGTLKPWALEIVNRFDSFTEVSQSGRGLHIIVRGKLADGAAFKRAGIEVYDRARYFALTGNLLEGWNGSVEDRQEQLNAWVSEFRATEKAQRPAHEVPALQQTCTNGSNAYDRYSKYLDKLPPAISGQNGHDQTYHAACLGVHGFALSESETHTALMQWNKRCVPQWHEKDLLRKVSEAVKAKSDKVRGWLLDAPNPNGYRYAQSLPADDLSEVEPYRTIKPLELLKYDTLQDPNALFKNRWLCRGGSVLFVGQSGLGKSSLAMMTVLWSLGEALFGITPVKPLKIDVIQAENDDGDLAEMFQGVVHGMGLSNRVSEIQAQVTFIPETARTGKPFIELIDRIVSERKPDLLIIDPLLAYLGGDVNKQDVCSAFLRNGLNVIGQEYGTAFMLIHHTPKPLRGVPAAGRVKASDLSYLGAGSAELTNWARAVLTLREIEDGVFEFRAAKRGNRAGLTNVQGVPADHIFIEHSKQGICWKRSAWGSGPDMAENEALEAYVSDVLVGMNDGTYYSATEVRQIVEKETGKKKSQIYQPLTVWNRIYKKVLSLTKVVHMPGKFTRPNSGIPVNSDPFRSDQPNTPNSDVPESLKGPNGTGIKHKMEGKR